MIATCGPRVAAIPRWAGFTVTLSACGNRLNEIKKVREREINGSKSKEGNEEGSKAEEKGGNIM
jgi:hypothetical protein